MIASTLTRRFASVLVLHGWFSCCWCCFRTNQDSVRSFRTTEHEYSRGRFASKTGYLVVINVKGSEQSTGQVFLDTFGDYINDNKRKKGPLALVMLSRPYSKGICEGIEYVLRSMNAGGKRRVIVPPCLGFGEERAEFGKAVKIPPFATLEYVIELEKVSIAPS